TPHPLIVSSTLSLHDALPIFSASSNAAAKSALIPSRRGTSPGPRWWTSNGMAHLPQEIEIGQCDTINAPGSLQPQLHPEVRGLRSEEHTSELQSRENLVCRLL